MRRINSGLDIASLPLATLTLALLVALSVSPHAARAEPAHEPAPPTSTPPSAFDRPFAIAGYATAWHGAYGGLGVGGRARWEPFEHLGLDLFAEHLAVQTPHGFRHDHPIGFNAYIPIPLTTALRLRPLAGFCAVLSFIASDEAEAPHADDVLLGVHAGLGLELALGSHVSAFAEVQASAWLGHDRTVQGWTGAIDNGIAPFGVVQAALGLSWHLGAS